MGGEANDFGNAREQKLLVDTFRDLCEQWPDQFGKSGAAVRVRKIRLPGQLAYQVFREGKRRFEPLLKGFTALLPHETIGVVSLGQKQEPDLPSFPGLRQGM